MLWELKSEKKIIKPWGWEKLIELNKCYCVKELFMKKVKNVLQYHKKIETIIVLKGELNIVVNNKKKIQTRINNNN